MLICNFLVFLPESALWPNWQEDPSLVVPVRKFIIYKSPGEPFLWKQNLRFVLVLGRLPVLKILTGLWIMLLFEGNFYVSMGNLKKNSLRLSQRAFKPIKMLRWLHWSAWVFPSFSFNFIHNFSFMKICRLLFFE